MVKNYELKENHTDTSWDFQSIDFPELRITEKLHQRFHNESTRDNAIESYRKDFSNKIKRYDELIDYAQKCGIVRSPSTLKEFPDSIFFEDQQTGEKIRIPDFASYDEITKLVESLIENAIETHTERADTIHKLLEIKEPDGAHRDEYKQREFLSETPPKISIARMRPMISCKVTVLPVENEDLIPPYLFPKESWEALTEFMHATKDAHLAANNPQEIHFDLRPINREDVPVDLDSLVKEAERARTRKTFTPTCKVSPELIRASKQKTLSDVILASVKRCQEAGTLGNRTYSELVDKILKYQMDLDSHITEETVKSWRDGNALPNNRELYALIHMLVDANTENMINGDREHTSKAIITAYQSSQAAMEYLQKHPDYKGDDQHEEAQKFAALLKEAMPHAQTATLTKELNRHAIAFQLPQETLPHPSGTEEFMNSEPTLKSLISAENLRRIATQKNTTGPSLGTAWALKNILLELDPNFNEHEQKAFDRTYFSSTRRTGQAQDSILEHLHSKYPHASQVGRGV